MTPGPQFKLRTEREYRSHLFIFLSIRPWIDWLINSWYFSCHGSVRRHSLNAVEQGTTLYFDFHIELHLGRYLIYLNLTRRPQTFLDLGFGLEDTYHLLSIICYILGSILYKAECLSHTKICLQYYTGVHLSGSFHIWWILTVSSTCWVLKKERGALKEMDLPTQP